MNKKQRTDLILNNLDASVSWTTKNIAGMDADLTDPNLSVERRRQIERARGIASERVADHTEKARALRAGEIDCYDDDFGGRQR